MAGRGRPLTSRIASKIDAPAALPAEGSPLLAFPFDTSCCWVWTGAYSSKKHRKGAADRPVIQLAGRGSPVAHVFRVMLSILDGKPLDERGDVQAAHAPHCAEKARCVNPYHGYWSTQSWNQRDNHLGSTEHLGDL